MRNHQHNRWLNGRDYVAFTSLKMKSLSTRVGWRASRNSDTFRRRHVHSAASSSIHQTKRKRKTFTVHAKKNIQRSTSDIFNQLPHYARRFALVIFVVIAYSLNILPTFFPSSYFSRLLEASALCREYIKTTFAESQTQLSPRERKLSWVVESSA